MMRIVIMVFSNAPVCLPSTPADRLPPSEVRTALVDGFTRFLAEHGVAVDGVEDADGADCFALVFTARQTSPEPSLALLRDRLRAYGQSAGVTVRVQREDLFLAMHRI